MMANYIKQIISSVLLIVLTLLTVVKGDEQSHSDYLSVAFDSNEAEAMRSVVFNPFIIAGQVPISENYYEYAHHQLPDPIPPFWDVIALNRDTLIHYCDRGDLLPLNWANFPHKELLIPTALESCGVGYNISSTVLTYSILHQFGLPPHSWQDFFDLNRFPGRRALPTKARGIFEAALLADGVAKEELYPLLATDEGAQRAIDKLDSIKESIVWWEEISELQEWLLSGYVTLGIAQDGPLLMDEGRHNIGIVRNEALYRIRYLAIPTASKNRQLAYSFISFATHPSRQKELYTLLPYGSTLKQGWALFEESEQQHLTNTPKNLMHAIPEDYHFYLEHGERLNQLYERWYLDNALHIRSVDVNYAHHEEEHIIHLDEAQESVAPQNIDNPQFIGPPHPDDLMPSGVEKELSSQEEADFIDTIRAEFSEEAGDESPSSVIENPPLP